MLREAAAVCAAFPTGPASTAAPDPVTLGPAIADGDVGGSPPALRTYAGAAGAWDEEVHRAAAAVSLEGVTITKVVRTEHPAPVPVPPPPAGTPPGPRSSRPRPRSRSTRTP